MKLIRNILHFRYFLMVCLLCLRGGISFAAGTWTALANTAPGDIQTMLLLTDGTVMALDADDWTSWYQLTPDIHGSYVNGTWSVLAPMNYSRLYCSTDVLPDGRLFAAGGEYGAGTTNAEIYNPLNDAWTIIPIPAGLITTNNSASSGSENNAGFMDSYSALLVNGKVLVTPVFPDHSGETVTYDPVANIWSDARLVNGYDEDEAIGVMLPDDSILFVDDGAQTSERFIPALNQWLADAAVPVALFDPYGDEEGAAFLLPNGKAIFIGSTPVTAIYTPSGSTNPGTWVAGPAIPGSLGQPDAPAAMMFNGKILCALSPTPSGSGNIFTTPTYFYEYDYSSGASGTFTLVTAPGGGSNLNNVTYGDRMLVLPDGSVRFTLSDSQLYVYTPDLSPLAAGQPAISSLSQNADGSYHLVGTRFNGISQGAAYGDDAQMNSNYPLVRMTNNATGGVYYARTYNWSSAGIMTGTNLVTTDFALPASAPAGAYSLVVVANGNASAPQAFTLGATNRLVVFTWTNPVPITYGTPLSAIQLDATASTPGVFSYSPANGAVLSAGTHALSVIFTPTDTVDYSSVTDVVSLIVMPVNNYPPDLSAYAQTLLDYDPVAYWQLNETNVPPPADVITNAGSLELIGSGLPYNDVVQGGPGIVNNCAAFSNPSMDVSYLGTYIDIQNNSKLNPPGAFAVEFWARPHQAPTDFFCPVSSIDESENGAASREGWIFYEASGNQWSFRVGNVNGYVATLTGGTVTTNVWQHIAGVYNGSTVTLYVNGVAVAGPTSASGFTPNTNAAATLRIGATSFNNRTFDGSVDELAVYTNALTAAVVSAHYHAATTNNSGYGAQILASKPVGYWHLDEPAYAPYSIYSLPVANNIGSLSTLANGVYQPGTVPGVPGVPAAGFGSGNRACSFSVFSYIDVTSLYLGFTGALTLSAWAKTPSAPGTVQSVVSLGGGSYQLGISALGQPQFVDGTQTFGALVATNIVTDNQWHQLTGVYDGASSEYLYVDGRLAAHSSAAIARPLDNGDDLYIGSDPDPGTFEFFNGVIDEVAIFTNALSADQVLWLYSTGSDATLLGAAKNPGLPDSVNLTFLTIPGENYQLQYSTNLSQTNWTALGSPILATNSTLSITDNPGSVPQRFYRALLVP